METVPSAERRQIFLACRAIFSGTNANIRKTKTIRAHLENHHESLQALIPSYNVWRALPVVKCFLEKGLFQSNSKAQVEFPGLLEPCSVRQTQHAALEQEASRSAAQVLQEVTETYEAQQCQEEEENKKGSGGPVPEPAMASIPIAVNSGAVAEHVWANTSDQTLSAERPPAPLFPLYLPYHTQHHILTTVQKVLEECIFDFCQKWLPDELARRGWDCAAAVELSKWTRLLGPWASQLPDGTLRPSDLALETMLATVVKIRHTAVHRLPTTAQGVCDLVAVAVKLAATLGDALRTAQLDDLHRDLQEKTTILESNKSLLEANLACQLDNIQAEREQLDRREQALRAKTIQDDGENKRMVGLLVERSLDQIFNLCAVGPEAETDCSLGFAVILPEWTRGLLRGRTVGRSLGLGLRVFGVLCGLLLLAWVVWHRASMD
ncbi:uncharacterized protein BO95DRAFT_469939 [Aspergillus brunneoviolaceus CBS 621.78]|uniref:Uncharacterized protein n=1 Tax=Aspergillus brunneoviolaceus CBS 621.78 TaxID=1450534 RepID=A0ACD1GP52_9EURO|nr:hypothetical protein BO95DRAFT_469939 [Aspergillus brunneoviolaceus CBS 621.78]RAH51135.1 hypothetical protein BO95DRAFT_469939 [Aspergillus brunneoviolaceus CBS 621.78]